MAAELVKVTTEQDFKDALKEQGKNLSVVHFCAEWAEQCKQMNEVLVELSKCHPDVKYLLVDAEDIPEISVEYDIEAVPTFVFVKNNQTIGRLNGANAPELTKMVKEHISTVAPSTVDPKEALNKRLKSLIEQDECVLFMKGNPDEPRCGFSRQTVEILKAHDCKYSTFDILQDPEVRQGLKEYSDWPTFPQLYVKGELIGGLDIIKEMVNENELTKVVPTTANEKDRLNARIKSIITQSPVVLLMKGNPDGPKCGFSRQMIEILKPLNVKFSHFDILSDQAIREGVKVYSDWPTYPQVYVKGELIGGLDIIKEMRQAGELETALQG